MKSVLAGQIRTGTWGRLLGGAISLGAVSGAPLLAQAAGYPVRPAPMPESEEIALARSAAPAVISEHATVYVLRSTGPAVSVTGTNGCICMVSRDLHRGSRYPICYDQEASRTIFFQELMELRLRSEGRSEAEVKRQVAAAYAAGQLHPPTQTALIYMMSRSQILYSAPESTGVRVGPWHPHLMIAVPHATGEQFGFGPDGKAGPFSVDRTGETGAQLIVPVDAWSDGSKAE